MDKTITLDQAVAYFGSRSEMARRLNIKPQAIYQWNGKIPELRQFQIERIIDAEKRKETP